MMTAHNPQSMTRVLTSKYRDMTQMRGGYAVPSFFLRTK
jgi:hypothetical protein